VPFGCELLAAQEVRGGAMSSELSQLEMKCLRAAQELLSLNWGASSPQVRAAVDAMLIGPPRDSAALSFLITESEKVPVQFEPSRRLRDLVECAAELHTQHQRAANFERWARGAA
jgi:hypothetical protein